MSIIVQVPPNSVFAISSFAAFKKSERWAQNNLLVLPHQSLLPTFFFLLI